MEFMKQAIPQQPELADNPAKVPPLAAIFQTFWLIRVSKCDKTTVSGKH
jgi:hypothetical protein